ncbi:MAG: hypothetical protein R2845_13700 [Thermomicrobiales bacterium]
MNFTGEQLRKLQGLVDPGMLVVNQFSFSLFDTRWANLNFDTCTELGIGVMARPLRAALWRRIREDRTIR